MWQVDNGQNGNMSDRWGGGPAGKCGTVHGKSINLVTRALKT